MIPGEIIRLYTIPILHPEPAKGPWIFRKLKMTFILVESLFPVLSESKSLAPVNVVDAHEAIGLHSFSAVTGACCQWSGNCQWTG